MAVKVRLTRIGANNNIMFRIIAADSRSPRDGRFLETLGWYNPNKPGVNYKVDLERIDYWRSKGAIVSDTVKSIVSKARKKAE